MGRGLLRFTDSQDRGGVGLASGGFGTEAPRVVQKGIGPKGRAVLFGMPSGAPCLGNTTWPNATKMRIPKSLPGRIRIKIKINLGLRKEKVLLRGLQRP